MELIDKLDKIAERASDESKVNIYRNAAAELRKMVLQQEEWVAYYRQEMEYYRERMETYRKEAERCRQVSREYLNKLMKVYGTDSN